MSFASIVTRSLTITTLAALATTVACSGTPTSSHEGATTPAVTAPMHKAQTAPLHVPASDEAKKLGVDHWSFHMAKTDVVEIRGMGPDGARVFAAEAVLTDDGEGKATEFRLADGVLRVNGKGQMEQNEVGERSKIMLAHLGADTKVFATTSRVAFDACGDATAYWYVMLAAEAVTCGSAPFTLVGFAACAVAAAAAAQAASAMNTACAPQLCVADYQCQDAYGPNYVCSGGGCVSSTITYGGGGGGGGGDDDDDDDDTQVADDYGSSCGGTTACTSGWCNGGSCSAFAD
jgi:hypothetical protein